jgi:hypothetical protein
MLTKDSMPLMRGVTSNATLVGAWAVRVGEMVKLHIFNAIFTT